MLASGLRIGRYEVADRLGKGSFGVVHLARDVELGRNVALKVLKPEYLDHPQIIQRFLKEARAAATIGHPGIVTVFECGQIANTGTRADGNAYIAMELLRGTSLTDRMDRDGRLSSSTVIAIGCQLASALAAAHAAGIIHRDLKPDNVFLIPDSAVHGGERVKLLDFGMAKLAEQDGAPQTHSNIILGTPRYMSPEQARSSAKIDHRTDIYALGCILYQLSTGHPPFTGDAGEVIVQHQSTPAPRPSSIVAVPASLDSLIVRMLAKQPDERPQSMLEVERELAAAGIAEADSPTNVFPKKAVEEDTTTVADATTVQEHVRVHWRSPRVLALAGGGLVLGGLITFLMLRESPGTRIAGDNNPARVGIEPRRPSAALLAGSESRLSIADAGVAGDPSPPRTVASNEAQRVRAECQALYDGNQWQLLRECAARLAPLDPGAARAFEEHANQALPPPSTQKRTECKQLVLDKRWQDAIDCASELERLKDPEAAELRADADAEARAEAGLRRLSAAADANNLKAAKKELDQIAATSVYRKEAETTYREAESAVVKVMISRANNARARDKTCKDYQAVLEDAVAQGVEGQVKVAVRCGPASAPVGCDAARLREDADTKLMQSLDAAALLSYEQAIKCGATGDVFMKAFMAACRSRNEAKARQYYTRLPGNKRESISQICVRNGITF